MLSFKNWIDEYSQILESEILLEAMGSNDKGVLHELLVGKHLHGDHMSPDAKTKHDEIKSKITPDEYKEHNAIAHTTANHIKTHAESLGHGKIVSTHWTSKPGDIGRVAGEKHSESQQENPSDIMLRHANGAHTGYSLKVTGKKNGKVPVGNPGAKQTDKHLGTDAVKHYDDAHKQLVAKHPVLSGMSKAQQKAHIKTAPDIRASAEHLGNSAIKNIRDTWHAGLSKMPTKDLAHHIRHNLIHANETKTAMYKSTAGGSEKDHGVHIEHPATSMNHVFLDHKNISVHKAGNNSIEFKHNGKTFLRHRLKSESTPVVTGLKGSIE